MLRRVRVFLSCLVTVAVVASLVQGLAFVTASHSSRALAASVTGTAGQFVSATGKIIDTRPASNKGPYNTPMPANQWRTVQIGGATVDGGGTIPNDISAVLVNVAATNQTGSGYVWAEPDGGSAHTTMLVYPVSGNVSNSGIVAVPDDGKIALQVATSTDLVVSIEGYYTAGNGTVAPGGYSPVTPVRLANSATSNNMAAGPLAPGTTVTVQATGKAGIPAGASAVFVNITELYSSGSGQGNLTPYASDQSKPPTSMSFPPGSVSSSYAMGTQVPLSADGKFNIWIGQANAVNLTVDVAGYFTPGTSSGAFTPAIARMYDTRVTGHTTVAAGATLVVPVGGVGGVPVVGSGISAAAVNVTALAPSSASGYLRIWANGATEPTTSGMVDYAPGDRSNFLTSSLGSSDGAIEIHNVGNAAVNVVVDLEGWYSNASTAIPNGQTQTQQSVTLQAANNTGAGPWATYQYRVGTSGTFSRIPTSDAADGNGNNPSAWPVATSNGKFTAYTWNLRATLAALSANNGVAPDALVQVVACYGASQTDSNPVCGMPTDIDFSQADGSGSSTTIGSGSLDELTGDFEIAATDADTSQSLGDLSVGRTLTTLKPSNQSGAAGVFGPGWTADLSGPDTGSADVTPVDNSAHGFILLTDTDGVETTYARDPNNVHRFIGVDSDNDESSVVTTSSSQGNSSDLCPGLAAGLSLITVTEADGTATTWAKTGGGWLTECVQQPGSNSTSTYTYDSAGLVTRILAPVPGGVSCSTPTTTPGCRSLTLTYSSINAGGSNVTRLSEIDLSIPQSLGVANSIPMANYDYDAAGRLAHAWDARISPALKTGYTYTPANRVATLTPPGLAAWSFAYDSSSRLSTASRPDPSGSTATTTIVYDLSPSTAGSKAGPVDLSASFTATWGETADLPVTGTAVFQPDHNPAGTTVSAVVGSDWQFASIDYLDINGRIVNSASYGANAWQIDTTQYDGYGNEIWNLSAGNRAQSLSPTADTDAYVAALSTASTVDSVDAAALLRSDTISDPLTSNVTDTYGPTHPVLLANGNTIDARTHVASGYDEGAPTSTLDPITGTPVNPANMKPYGLPTTKIITAWDVQAKLDTAWPDIQVVRTGYDSVKSGDTSGWALGQSSSSTVQMGQIPSNNDLVTRTRYDSNGRVIEQRLPNDAGGSSPRTTLTTYYASSGSGACVDPTRVGLICSTAPAAQPTSGSPLAVVTYSYNQYGHLTAETDTFGIGSSQVIRTSTTGYDSSERRVSSSISVTPTSSGGTPVPANAYSYSTTNGLPVSTSTGSGPGITTIATGYNSVGQKTSYTDATGNVSNNGYDIDGRAVSVDDGKGGTATSYDGSGEHRGLPTHGDIGVTGAPSIFATTYNDAGDVASETYPDGLVANRSYDNAGELTNLKYSKSGVTWMDFTQRFNALGQVAYQTSPQSNQFLSYDPADRLYSVQDTFGGTCVTRRYTYDSHSNRTSLATYPAATGGACSLNTNAVTTGYTYDDADRLTNDTAGSYAYDAMGRSTSIPAGDAQGVGAHALIAGSVTIGFHANDMVATEHQAATTDNFTLDPSQKRISTQTEGTTTITNHYSDTGDSPDWIASGSTWNRNIVGIDGNLAATTDQTGAVTLQLDNPHGDIVATAPDLANSTGLSGYHESTEFGVPRDSAAPASYGWLGGKKRFSNYLGGLFIMGQRLYSPIIGRFESVDPVAGGNSNAYIYPCDPVNEGDIDGRKVIHLTDRFGNHLIISVSKQRHILAHGISPHVVAIGIHRARGLYGTRYAGQYVYRFHIDKTTCSFFGGCETETAGVQAYVNFNKSPGQVTSAYCDVDGYYVEVCPTWVNAGT